MYKYGMKLRGFSIGCQPMKNLQGWRDCLDDADEYYSILWYSEPLTDEECAQYDLVFLGIE